MKKSNAGVDVGGNRHHATETFTIITTQANDVLKPVHDRMPVINKAENYDECLTRK